MRGIFGLFIVGAFLTAVLMTVGCSGSGTPLDPAIDEMSYIQEGQSGGAMLWGAWNVSINTETEEVEITQLRTADDTLNVLGFLEPPALSSMSISNLGIQPTLNKVTVDVSLNHPFSAGGQFTGFDVKGIVFGPDLLNADGYTLWMNPGDFSSVAFGYKDGLLGVSDSTANYGSSDWGYKYFADGLGVNTDLPTFFSNSTNLNNRGKFSEGSTNTRHYDLDFQTPSKFLVFNYAIVANYDWPTGSPPYTLTDFPIATANCHEAFCINAYVITNGLWYDPVWATGGGTLSLDVEVWDWQGLGNTSVTLNNPVGTPTLLSTCIPGSTTYSGIYSFVNMSISPNSANPLPITITATDTSATFGSAWFMGLLPSSNSQYATNVYTVIKTQVNVATAGNYYSTTSTSDFLMWQYPHQSAGVCWDFVDYYDFTAPPQSGRHDISVIGKNGLLKVIDTVGWGPAGQPPPGGGVIYDFPLPLGVAGPIPAPYFPGPPPNLAAPWYPTRFDSNSAEFETAICSGNVSPYVFSPLPSPEYSITQIYHVPPGAGGPPFLLDVDPFMLFPGASPWDVGVDVTNGFFNNTTSTFGSLYGLFFYDYTVWQNCNYIFPPPGPPPGTAWVFELPLPVTGAINAIALPTTMGAPGPGGPAAVDDSSVWGVCGSMAVDNMPGNQPGLTTANPTMVYILDTNGDITAFEVDFAAGIFQPYSEMIASFFGTGNMPADIEMIDSSQIALNQPKGYVPNRNLLAVAMVDGNLGSTQGDWWIDVYIMSQGTNTATLLGSTPRNSGQPFLALDVDETTGEIYVLHGSNAHVGNTAITVYKFV